MSDSTPRQPWSPEPSNAPTDYTWSTGYTDPASWPPPTSQPVWTPEPPQPPRKPSLWKQVGLAALAGAVGMGLGLQVAGLPVLQRVLPLNPQPSVTVPVDPQSNANDPTTTDPTTNDPTTNDPSTGQSGTSGSGSSASGGSSNSGTTTTISTAGVVLINVSSSSGEGAGTGMILTSDGRVLTNYHVVEGSTQVQVTVAATDRTYTATVVGRDAVADVAVLQLKNASGLATVKPDDDQLKVGDAVTAVGNARGQGYLTSASGQVSSLNETLTVSDTKGESRELSGAIETTAAAVPGDSGGPMFDAEGEVVGMTTAGSTVQTSRRSGTSTSYAVPIDTALQVVDDIVAGKESGTTKVGAKPYLGVSVVGTTGGVGVQAVVRGGPASDAGVRAGDILVALDGTQLTDRTALSDKLAEYEPGQKVRLTWLDSSGNQKTATITLGESPVN